MSGLAEMRLVDRVYACETFKMAKSLVPLVPYQPQFARAVGKWMLNAASNARLFYPDYLPADHQAAPEYRDLTRGVIGYEAITTQSMHGDHPVPFAERDDWKNTFTPSGEVAVWRKVGHYSMYGSSFAGIFSCVGRTSDPTILELDCLKTDFAGSGAHPTFLYYNPHLEPRTITTNVGSEIVDLYDLISKRLIAQACVGMTELHLPADSALVIARVPPGKTSLSW